MDKGKDKEKIDKFNYESIDENYIKNKDIEEIEFTLLDSEYELYQDFLKKHEKCQFDKDGKNKFGPYKGCISIKFTRTGLGNVAVCKCNGCKASSDLTDYDLW